ncbi:unnamed protein product [Porites lobata]|uniref:Uncharacterized protein n=1 Tax=Porites lobata TaxID=104759 RepID=A0ABN8QI35_9CNID|nr:unnamed protein product [Porites lobata]
MTYFPVYIYWDTFTYCREHILKRFKTRNFEEAFRTFYQGFLYPVSIILTAGNKLNICSNISVSLSTNLALFKHDLQGLNVRGLVQEPYIDDNLNTCLRVLERYYNQVGLEIKQG